MFRELGRPQVATFAAAVRIGRAGDPPGAIQKYVEEMLDRGSRYLNIEAKLGSGICFVLGCSLPETQ